MTPPTEHECDGRLGGGETVERAPAYGWARRAAYGGGGVAGRMARGMLTPLSWAWGAAAERRLGAQREGKRDRRLAAPAISVGNVTVGGGGKTSLVEWIVRAGAPQGAIVAVLSRGYGRDAGAPQALPPGSRSIPVAAAAEVGDEPALLARAGAWVGVSADRFLAAEAIEGLGVQPDLYVLDDGLQRRSVPCALDLVVFTAADLTAPARCIPAGPLRQRSSWRPPRAAWVVTGADPRDREWPHGSIGRAYSGWWRELAGTAAEWEAAGTVSLESWHVGGESPFDAGSRPLVAFAGVARPESIGAFARRAGFEIAAMVVFRDHHRYRVRDIASLRATHPGAAFVTTEKDAVKCDPAWFGDAPVGVLRRRLEPGDPDLLKREIEAATLWQP